ncbi:hypothetical protein OIU34_26635 [Pararhizobium sp. BT-229]|uniref:hypothetical protein n=1 Tax=Pararhizobium sp. BT-229 TaxID=2986923 RepID=UPI0021F76724|nr:hypothetical protein [Pararhizobium sp. BT-229]MCV9965460.1 hypothetical protein [Pararhizobium sp. BT-229]
MTRVRFTADFDYRPVPQVTTAYLAGMEQTVKQDCAAQAIAAGKAVLLKPPGRKPKGAGDGEATIGR